MKIKNEVKIKLTPSYKTLKANKSCDLDFLIQIKAPLDGIPVLSRPSMNLSLVIDVSGSMAGRPLEYAKKAAISLIRDLSERDRLSLVSYSSNIEILSDSHSVTEEYKQKVINLVNSLSANGATDLHSGWLHGAKTIAPFVKEYDLTRVFLLSDGQANCGIVDTSRIKEEAQKLRTSGIETSSFGIGFHFNESLMTLIAQGGMAFYAESSESLIEYFQQEISLMSKIRARNLNCSVSAKVDGCSVDFDILNDIDYLDGKYILSNLIYGGESWMIAKVKAGDVKEFVDISVSVNWINLDGSLSEQSCSITVLADEKMKKTKNKVLIERLKEIEAANLQRKAMKEAVLGRWDEVNKIVGDIQSISKGNMYVSEVANSLGQISSLRDSNLFSKEATYGSFSMNTRSVSLDEKVDSLDDSLGLKKARQGKSTKAKKDDGGLS